MAALPLMYKYSHSGLRFQDIKTRVLSGMDLITKQTPRSDLTQLNTQTVRSKHCTFHCLFMIPKAASAVQSWNKAKNPRSASLSKDSKEVKLIF